jgi:hypothetical protein
VTEDERAAIVTAMYQQSDNDELDEPEHHHEILKKEFDFEMGGKFVTLTIDGKKVDVPSIHYVHTLERTITSQARQYLRMNSELKRLRAAINGLIGDLNDVNRELARKINLRDLP